MKNKQLIQILIPLAAGIILIAISSLFPNFSRICELKVYDSKMRLTAKLKSQNKATAARIKIINVTNSTISEMGWPKKADHARLIDVLSQHKASLIAYDWIFHEQDDELIRAVKKSGRVLWPVLFDLNPDGGYGREKYSLSTVNLMDNFSIGTKPSPSTLWHATAATHSHPGILDNAIGMGHISARNEEGSPFSDGVYRKMAMVIDFAGKPFPSLALQVVCHYLHIPLNKVRIIPGREIVLPQGVFPDTGQVKDIHIPINDQGEMWIYFPGLWEDNYFEPFWFENVLDKHKDPPLPRLLEYDRKFNDNICFVGNASGKSKDTHVIPVEDNFPGVGIHAAAVYTILSGSFISFPHPAIEVLIILVMALAIGAISCSKPPLQASVLHLSVMAGYVVVTYWVFGEHHLNLPTVFPALAILVGGVASLAYQFVWEQREKDNLLREYKEIHSGLQKKDREIRQLVLKQERTKQQAEEKHKALGLVESEKNNILKRMTALEKRLAERKDLVIQPLQKYVTLAEEWEQLRKESLQAGIITKNKKMLEIFRRVKKAAKSTSPVLILGEMGTGKELIAQAIHALSDRRDHEFVVVPTIQENLVESELFGYMKGAFTGADKDKPGFFARADGGTIFLDEIGEVTPGIQVKLLGVLSRAEYTPVGSTRACKTDARVVAATNRNLKKEMKAGNFREDLFFRLNVISIQLPPLKERKEDIEFLADHFIDLYTRKQDRKIEGFSQKALEVLLDYNWPGNIRELENVIERAVALTDEKLITEADLELTFFDDSDVPVSEISVETDKSLFAKDNSPQESLDVSGDKAFLALLNQNDFIIGKTAEDMGKGRDATRERFKGLCLMALAENEWEVFQAAKSIATGDENQMRAESKITEYYNNTKDELRNYASLEELQQQIGKKYRNMPRKFHRYILNMYEARKENNGIIRSEE